MKKVVYTAIFGSRDTHPEIKDVPGDCDFICFTSEDLPESDLWTNVWFPKVYNNPKDARRFKLLPHRYFPCHEKSIWVDANITLNPGWIEATKTDTDILFLKHWELVENAYKEGRRCITMEKDDPQVINDELEFFKSEGLPGNIPVSATGILVRKHNKQHLIDFHELWWDTVRDYSCRDQIALPYARWKTGLEYEEVEYRKYDWWFEIGPHRRRKPCKDT